MSKADHANGDDKYIPTYLGRYLCILKTMAGSLEGLTVEGGWEFEEEELASRPPAHPTHHSSTTVFTTHLHLRNLSLSVRGVRVTEKGYKDKNDLGEDWDSYRNYGCLYTDMSPDGVGGLRPCREFGKRLKFTHGDFVQSGCADVCRRGWSCSE